MIVRWCYSSKSLLSCSILQLNANFFITKFNNFSSIIKSYYCFFLINQPSFCKTAFKQMFFSTSIFLMRIFLMIFIVQVYLLFLNYQILKQYKIYKQMQNNLKGKQIKNYIIGQIIVGYNDMYLLEGKQINGADVTILMIQKKNMEQESFVSYNNLLSQNSYKIHPIYQEAIQSAKNIYIVMEKVDKISSQLIDYKNIIPSIVDLYRNMGQYKLQQSEVFINKQGKIVYMPFYKKLQITSKFYAQFHNKSVLGDIFSKIVPIQNKNIALDIFIKHIDNPNAASIIINQLSKQIAPINNINYPSIEQSDDDEQIMQLMSKVKVNSDMKKQAGQQFIRLSAQREDHGQNSKQIKNIMQNVESSMFQIKSINSSKTNKTKIEIKMSESKLNQNQFQLYFKSYFQGLKFLKKSIKQFLSFYKNGFAGIITSYLIVLILTLRKTYMISALNNKEDIFDLKINMNTISIQKYLAILKKQIINEAKMIVQFKTIIQKCSMPMKTYTILAPYLEDDISLIDFNQIHNFTFFFLSALLKNKDLKHIHYVYVVDSMYILLHKNYEIVFFEDDFPKKWNQQYFETKVILIENLVPSWSLSRS